MRVEPGEQGLDGIGADEGFAKAPDRRLVGRVVTVVETQEAAEAAAIENLKLGLCVRQAVERLQNQRLEHHDCVQRPPTAPATIRSLQGRIQRGPEYLEVDQAAQLLQRIARRRQGCIPLVEIKKATLCRHFTPPSLSSMESQSRSHRHR